MPLSRRTFLATGGTVSAFGLLRRTHAGTRSAAKKEEQMEITRVGSQPSNKGPADWFTGTVRIDPLFPARAPARAAGNNVTFEPGARTAWHTHPLGQTLIVTARLRLGPAGGQPGRGGSVPATWSGSLRARSIGTGRRRPRP